MHLLNCYCYIADMFCGKWGAARCSGERLFDFLGSYAASEQTPMQFNYRYVDHNDTLTLPRGVQPLDKGTQQCSLDLQVRPVDLRIKKYI